MLHRTGFYRSLPKLKLTRSDNVTYYNQEEKSKAFEYVNVELETVEEEKEGFKPTKRNDCPCVIL